MQRTLLLFIIFFYITTCFATPIGNSLTNETDTSIGNFSPRVHWSGAISTASGGTSGLSSGAIIGIVVGVAFGGCLLLFLLCICISVVVGCCKYP